MNFEQHTRFDTNSDPLFIIKSKLINRLIFFEAVFGSFIFVLAIFLVQDYIYSYRCYADLICITAMYVVYIFKDRTGLKFKVAAGTLFLYIVFLSSISQNGLISTQKYLLPFIPLLLILVLDWKKAAFIYGIVMASFALTAYFYINGYWEHPTLDSINELKIIWLILGLLIALSGGVVLMISNSFIHEISRMVSDLQAITIELKHKNQQNKHLLKEKNIMLQEIHHRVKNNLAVVSGLLELQMQFVDDEKVKSIIKKSVNRIMSIAKVHNMLYLSEDFSKIPFDRYINELADVIISTMNANRENIEFKSAINVKHLSIKQGVPLGIIFNELITNSLKYAFAGVENKRISITMTQSNNQIHVSYEDNGVGMGHIQEVEKGGLGFSIIDSLLDQLQARYQYETQRKFKLTFSFPVNE